MTRFGYRTTTWKDKFINFNTKLSRCQPVTDCQPIASRGGAIHTRHVFRNERTCTFVRSYTLLRRRLATTTEWQENDRGHTQFDITPPPAPHTILSTWRYVMTSFNGLMMTSVCEHVRGCARSCVEYFRCEVRELVDQALAVDFVKNASRVVVPNTHTLSLSPCCHM